jgi:hypothetical protein
VACKKTGKKGCPQKTGTSVCRRRHARPWGGGISWTGDEHREYPRRIWNHRVPSRDRVRRGGPPPRVDPHRGGGGASPRPVIALRGHRGLDSHCVRQRQYHQLRRPCPTRGGISLEKSYILARQVHLRARCHVVQDRAMGGGV